MPRRLTARLFVAREDSQQAPVDQTDQHVSLTGTKDIRGRLTIKNVATFCSATSPLMSIPTVC